ncbi:MAG: SDR family oxidoreductase [Pseudomonadota bacterium]
MGEHRLNNRTVLITGGARGLGRSMALALASAGARVAVTGSTDSDALRRTATDLRELAGAERCLAFVSDVTDDLEAVASVERCIDSFGQLDVLVNNAGRGLRLISETFNTEPTRFWEADREAWETIVNVNINGTFAMAKAAVPHMLERGFGKIINVSTSDITMVRRGYSPYGPSKAFVEAASRAWAQELAGTGVDVNVLLPGGAADTDILPPSPDKKGADGNLLPVTVMDEAIVWMVSEASDGRTGERYIGRLWDGPDAARDQHADKPRIM